MNENESAPFTPFPGNRLPALLGVYFLIHIVIRLAISDTLSLDEAEQVLVSQWFQWGYSGQPPLYAWVQHLLFDLLGTNLLALALLKNGLLLSAYMLFWWTARRLWPDRPTLVTLAVLSWLLIPQIVWEAQRDLSHSVMVLVLASASLWAVALVLNPGPARESPKVVPARGGSSSVPHVPSPASEGPSSNPGRPGPDTWWYLAYGLLMGLGMLSKYNFVAFAGALNLALLTLPRGRRILLNWRTFLAVGAGAAVFTPHFLWTLSYWDVAVRSLSKVDASAANNRLTGFGALVLAGVSFLTPLWIICLGFFPKLFKAGGPRGDTALHRLIPRYLLVLAAGLTFGVLVLGVSQVKERWMIPFLFLAPLYLFSGAGGRSLAPGRVRWFVRMAAAAAVVTLLAASTRVVLGPRMGVTTRVNYPFNQVVQALPHEAQGDVTVLTHNTWFAGNLLKRLPQAHAYVPGYILAPPDLERPILVVWDAVRSPELPPEIREDLGSRFGVDPGRLPDVAPPEAAGPGDSQLNPPDPDGFHAEFRTFPYKFGAGRVARVGFILLAPSALSGGSR